MNRFIAGARIPENSERLFPMPCQNCRYRKKCPYICDQALCRAACGGRTEAQDLRAEADRLLESVSRAGGVCCPLNGGGALEKALLRALCLEMDQIGDLVRMTGYGA